MSHLLAVLVFPDAELPGFEVGEQLISVEQTAAADLLQFDVPIVNMGVEGRLAAPKQLAGFLDCDEVVAGLAGDLPVNGRLDGGRDNRLEEVPEEFGDGRFEIHVS